MAAVRRDVFSLQAAAEELFGTQKAQVFMSGIRPVTKHVR